jgi:hypothetical protein
MGIVRRLLDQDRFSARLIWWGYAYDLHTVEASECLCQRFPVQPDIGQDENTHSAICDHAHRRTHQRTPAIRP